jgi:hypothetical protein
MSIEEFRAHGGFVEPPVVHWPHQKLNVQIIGESTDRITKGASSSSSKTTTNSRKMYEIETSTTETSTLKLKRPKPLQRNESKLENILGITRKGKELGSQQS